MRSCAWLRRKASISDQPLQAQTGGPPHGQTPQTKQPRHALCEVLDLEKELIRVQSDRDSMKHQLDVCEANKLGLEKVGDPPG